MTGSSRQNTAMISCSALQAEVESLCRNHWPAERLVFLPSTMHIHPEMLGSSLISAIEKELSRKRCVVLIYGDCCAAMTAAESMPGVARTRGRNCFELLLGTEEYRRLARQNVFFLLPEWVGHWKEIFAVELGLSRENATDLMQEMHSRLYFLDTGLAPPEESCLKECSDYCGLPYEVHSASLEHLHSLIEDAMFRAVCTR